MLILVINCGSSSAKFAVIETEDARELLSGRAQRLSSPEATLDWHREGEQQSRPIPGAQHEAALRAVIALLEESGLAERLRGVGHRVVHGGARFSSASRVTPEVRAAIVSCIPLSPLHNAAGLAGLDVAQELFPALPQVVVFDTAFHQTLPPKAFTYAVPHAWLEQHQLRRYGFHGTSHRFVAQQAATQLGLPPGDHALVTAHLGNGCSCAAIRDGRSVDTTMGLTPLEGLVMGTRSGSVDPTVVTYMAEALDKPAAQIVLALDQQSGLLGLSGLSNDLRVIEEKAAQGHARAQLSLEIFCYVLAKAIAALVVPLGRLDALVFTGGIGENSALVRGRVIGQLGFLGLFLDAAANAAHGRSSQGRITRGARPQALVVPTNEELLIARDTAAIIARG